ncbi:hypothetical protein DH86_00002579, partial [Scytalidium sp. 3C]
MPADRRAISSHATRAQGRRRKAAQLRSWIGPDRILGLMDMESPLSGALLSPTSSPKPTGGDFSALQLPQGVEPVMIQDLAKIINLDIRGMYPYEVCLHVHPAERGWFPYMISDICCLHAMMFSLRAFVDGPSNEIQLSRAAAFHHAQTLRLLQARLNDFAQGQRDIVLGDSTLMVIIFLSLAAELMGNFQAAENHVSGLLKIVNLRGGVASLGTNNNVQVKVCRADLGLALRTGNRPQLFRKGIAWDCFIADRGVIHCLHEHNKAQMDAFVDTLAPKLANCWKDLHAFSCLSNMAYQTTRKLSPDTYNEVMISVLYRLTHLCFE